jgi:hypothetical protein
MNVIGLATGLNPVCGKVVSLSVRSRADGEAG